MRDTVPGLNAFLACHGRQVPQPDYTLPYCHSLPPARCSGLATAALQVISAAAPGARPFFLFFFGGTVAGSVAWALLPLALARLLLDA